MATAIAKVGFGFGFGLTSLSSSPPPSPPRRSNLSFSRVSDTSFGCCKRRSTPLCLVAASSSLVDDQQLSSSSSSVSFTEAENLLIEAVIGIQGRGRSASPQQIKDVENAIQVLEAAQEGVSDPTSSSLIEGRWQLIFTTRPGTASPIQRTFVGVDYFNVFQEVFLRTEDPRVSNIVQFSDAIGELKVEGTTFVLQKKTDPRQRLLSAISTGAGVTEAIDYLVTQTQLVGKGESELPVGEWQLLWSSQMETDSWIENAANGLMGKQIVKENGQLKILVDILLGFRFSMDGTFVKSGSKTYNVNMDDAAILAGPFGVPMEMKNSFKLELLYADEKIRISRGYNQIVFVHLCVDGSAKRK
ncbi:hypothetical protein AQUCO_00900028v1 [Aquilegia coerulea]|uniref:Plastid lipid-associated protein/fibrillin conserved domain-containing protein n=1 Tax=Aquilegia coerulea TaxID=218851 RepID=A0A2G5EBJ4_AQUCA|nr:hypothetical protein AQUCO_00900028v1 [Aquilegia coerulea]